MQLSFAIATETDAAAVARLQTDTHIHLLEKFGRSTSRSVVTEKTVLTGMKTARVLMARSQGEIVAMLSLAIKKPWAIDPAYFTDVPRPLYLNNMAVAPAYQRLGVGRRMLEQARIIAREWPADAIRLDAYDNETGAGGFYAKCGYREMGRVTYRKTPLIYYEWVLKPAASQR